MLACPRGTVTSRYLSNLGTLNNPKWDQIDLATGVIGVLPEANGGGMQIPIGGIVDFASAGTPPLGWLLCGGQAVSRATYAVLFGVIGTLYGAGDGVATFNLPDCRGRVVAGRDDMGGVVAGRISAMFNGTVLGGTGGAERHTLIAAQMPSHAHSGGSSVGAVLLQGGPNYSVTSGGINTGIQGSDQPHNNLQPTIVFNKIIRY